MFTIPGRTSPFRERIRSLAVSRWRDATRLVWTQWDRFLAAPPATRSVAFAAYLAALDAESAAAGELANLKLARAA